MGYDYVPRLSSVGLLTLPYYNAPPNPFKPLRTRYSKTGHGECTTYAYGRWLEIANGDVTKLDGLLETRLRTGGTWNGGAWYMASNPSVRAGKSNPQPGDIICLKIQGDTWDGHVGVVEEVHAGYIVCSESEHSDDLFQLVTRRASLGYTGNNPGNYYQRNHYELQGFLRMQGVPSPPAIPDFDMPTEWIVRVGEGEYLTEEEQLNNAVMGYVAMMNADPTLTLEACCGILGNMRGEVTLNPGCLQVGRPSAGGLVGWDPLTKWSHEAGLRGIPWTDGDAQCEWVLSDKYWAIYGGAWTLFTNFWDPSKAGGMTYDEFKHSTETPERLAELFCYAYEKAGTPHMNRRTEAARKFYDYLIGIDFTDSKRPYIHKMPVWMMAGNAKPKLIY